MSGGHTAVRDAERAAAVEALHGLAGTLLERRGAPRPVTASDDLVDLRTAVAERAASEEWPERKRDLVMAAIGDPEVARKADYLARLTPGRYQDHVVDYLMALESSRREAHQ